MIGIYKMVNLINGKFYVGSCINFQNRKKKHRKDLKAGKHHSIHLQRSWDKYGQDIFLFEWIEDVSKVENLLEREQFYLDILTPWNPNIGYNICKVAGSTLGYKHTEESKKKLSKVWQGRKHKGSTKILMSGNQIGKNNSFYGKKHTEEYKKSLSKIIEKYDLEGNFIEEYKSLQFASDKLKVSKSSISQCCRGFNKTSHGYIWKYK